MSSGNGATPQNSDLRQRLAELDRHDVGPDDPLSGVLASVRARIMEEAGARLRHGGSEEDRDREIRRLTDEVLEDEELRITPAQRRQLVRQVLSDTLGYGPLDELMEDPSVSEIMCNGAETIYVERNGQLQPTDLSFTDETHLRTVINRIARAAGRRVDESSPMVDARMSDGSRMNAILPPVALNGPVLTIRRFPDEQLTAEALIKLGTFTGELVEMLSACVAGRLNIVVSGGTSSGKTTVLNVLSSFIGGSERIITIEDSAELTLQQPHVISLEARPANTEGEGLVTIRELVRNALRMRPDRIVVGECRAGEALDMLQAMNTGHEGSLTTIHANSPRDVLRRLETMVLMSGYDLPVRAIREQMASTISLVLHLERLPDGRRIVRSLSEVLSLEDDTVLMQEIFAFDDRSQTCVRTPIAASFAPQLRQRGIRVGPPRRPE